MSTAAISRRCEVEIIASRRFVCQQENSLPSSTSLIAFVAAALVVLLIPGPGVLYVVARSVRQGRRAGLVSVLGLSAGGSRDLRCSPGLSGRLRRRQKQWVPAT